MSDAEHREWRAFIRRAAETWGEGRDGDSWLAGVRDAEAAWGVLQRACASPAVARRYYESWADGLTAWDVLPSIHQPALVPQRTDDRVLPIKAARVAAQRIPGAKMVELPGAEHLPGFAIRPKSSHSFGRSSGRHRQPRARSGCSRRSCSRIWWARPISSRDLVMRRGRPGSITTRGSCMTASSASTAAS